MNARRNAKARGSAAERELLHKFYDAGWGAFRAAGSGSIPIEVPDVIAGNKGKVLAIEIKYCSKDRQYLKNQEITDLQEFGRRFGCETWVAVKFTRRGWWFLPGDKIPSSGKHYVISFTYAQEKGKQLSEMI